MIDVVEPVSDSIVITDNVGARTIIPKVWVNVLVPISGTSVDIQTIGATYSIDYTTISFPVATTRAELAQKIIDML